MQNDSQVANLQAIKIYDHSHTIWDITKAKTGFTLIRVVVLNEYVVDETCDCDFCKHKKKTMGSFEKRNQMKFPPSTFSVFLLRLFLYFFFDSGFIRH